jgi:pimeloyl-ACP methyl ester carboxylesterase
MALQRMKLRDGRVLGFREYGLATGFPVFYMHGNLNSSLFMPAWERTQDLTAAAGARLIAVDRCGYGLSSVCPNRSYRSFASDIDSLVEHLGLHQQHFSVVGYSSGGPHALACAMHSKYSIKLRSLALVSSDAPYGALGGTWIRDMYGCDADTMNSFDKETMTNAYVLERSRANAADMEKSYSGMKNPARREAALADLAHSTASGLIGAASDMVLEAEAGGWHSLGPLHAMRDRCHVTLWHGDKDEDVPIAAGRALTVLLEGADVAASCGPGLITLNVIDGENHTLVRRHWSSILTRVILEANQALNPVSSSSL